MPTLADVDPTKEVISIKRDRLTPEKLNELKGKLDGHSPEKLLLQSCEMEDNCAPIIAEIIQAHPTLRVVKLLDNNFGQNAGRIIGEAIPSHRQSLEIKWVDPDDPEDQADAEEACEAARKQSSRTADSQQGPPWVPNCPRLRDLLKLKHDLFSVRPADLMRKAMDELTLGLHWFILFTMTHSKASGEIKPVDFYANNDLAQVDGIVQRQRKMTPKKICLAHASKEGFRALYMCFKEKLIAFDIRRLLNHVKAVNKANPKAPYYKSGRESIPVLARDLITCACVLHHRNGLLREDRIYEEELEAAKVFFSTARSFLQRLSEKPKRAKALKTLLNQMSDAARHHFGAVRRIGDVFRVLFQPNPTQTPYTLAELQDKMTDYPHLQSYIVLAMWTRFGPRKFQRAGLDETFEDLAMEEEEEAEDDDDGFVEHRKTTPKRPHWQFTQVKRYSLKDDQLCVENTSFLCDPQGITHTDLMNRAIDVIAIAFRDIAVKVAQSIAHKEGDDSKLSVVEAEFKRGIEQAEDTPLTKCSVAPGRFTAFRAEDHKKVKLYRAFCSEEKLKQSGDTMLRFVQEDPHFIDPRFLGEFFQRHKLPPRFNFQDHAARFVQIRDRVSHHTNLKDPQKLTRRSLEEDLKQFVRIVEEIAGGFSIPSTQVKGLAALSELIDALPSYFRWRRRQNAASKFDDDKVLSVAERTLGGLLASTGEGPLKPLGNHDSSPEALEELLLLTAQEQTARKPRTAIEQHAPVPKNIFSALLQHPDE